MADLDSDSAIKFSREQSFFDRSLGLRALIASLFIISLFLVLHFRQESVEVLELNSTAPGYIVAQVDFEFMDEEATILLKQDSVRDIGKVYNITHTAITAKRNEFENRLTHDQEWRQQAGGATFEELYEAVDILTKKLTQLRFTDIRTMQKMRENGISTDHFIIYTPQRVNQDLLLPRSVWNRIQNVAFPPDAVSPQAGNFIIANYAQQKWPIVEDIPAQRKLQKQIQSKVKSVFTKVSAGSRIIDQGEKVTSRHVAMLQAMKHELRERRNLWHPLTLLGSLILTLFIVAIGIAYFRYSQPDLLRSNRKLFLFVSVLVLTFIIAKLVEYFLLTSKSSLIETLRYPLFVPFAAILLGSLMSFSLATVAMAFLSIILAISLAFDMSGFLILNIAASMVALLSIRSLQKRKEIFVVCGKAWLCCIGIIFSMSFYHNTAWSFTVLSDILSTGGFLLLTAVLVVGVLPLFETLFRIMTDVTLMEFMDPNNDLLRRLTIEAPGTYQHSVVVGNMAESAAAAIGANALFCRVATLYHDVGKMVTSQYFTENQQGGMDMHQLLTPKESAQVIMAHVSEGVAMGRKAGLPEPFIDVIKEHHGTTLVYYFYRKQLELMGGEESLVDEQDFRYAGPKPRSKESAIIMIADTLEAASRSLDEFTEENVMRLAHTLVREKADDGQFDQCLLTFEELAIVKKVLVKTLFASSHRRIKYPKRA